MNWNGKSFDIYNYLRFGRDVVLLEQNNYGDIIRWYGWYNEDDLDENTVCVWRLKSLK